MPLALAYRQPLPSMAIAPSTPRPPDNARTLLASLLFPEQSGGLDPRGAYWPVLGHPPSEPLTKYMTPMNVPLPAVPKPPQCQISSPGFLTELMQSGASPLPAPAGFGGSAQSAAPVTSKSSFALAS